jgi:hypothetical protein
MKKLSDEQTESRMLKMPVSLWQKMDELAEFFEEKEEEHVSAQEVIRRKIADDYFVLPEENLTLFNNLAAEIVGVLKNNSVPVYLRKRDPRPPHVKHFPRSPEPRHEKHFSSVTPCPLHE